MRARSGSYAAAMLVCTFLAGAAAAVSAQAPANSPREISGEVLDAAGSPLPAAVVELHSWNGGLLSSQMTSAGGRFRFEVRDAGPFQLQLSSFGTSAAIPLDSPSLTNLVLRLPVRGPEADGAASPAPSASTSTVSLNDLQASAKAKSKLSSAREAMDKLDLSKAWRLVNEAIQAAPNWGRAYLYRGVLNMQSRNFAAAQSDLGVAVSQNPRDALALTELGKLYSSQGELSLADSCLRRALAIPPVRWPTYFELANLDVKRGNFSDAADMAEKAMDADPPAPAPVHFLAAESAEHLGNPQIAIQEYRSFLALATPSPEVNAAIAQAHRRLIALAGPH